MVVMVTGENGDYKSVSKKLVMSVVWIRCLVCLSIFVAVGAANAKFRFPAYDTIYVNDHANLLDGPTEQRLTDYLKEAEARGTQITVLTINQLSTYNAGPTIEPFATELFNHWGVGHADKNNGVMVLVSRFDRKMRIEIGAGYSWSWNAKMKRIIDDTFIPYFKRDEYQVGIEQGVIETIKVVTGRYPKSEAGFVSKVQRTVMSWWHKLGSWLFVILAPIVAFIASVVRKLWRLRPRNCERCNAKMVLLDERSDDQHIDGGQRLEEYLSSVDYDVWQCQSCMHINLYRYVSFFNSFETCPDCQYVTVSVDETVLTAATTSSTGLKRLDYECRQCDYSDTETRTIPRKSESSSSGGSSGSFGGGSSSGGGASGSW